MTDTSKNQASTDELAPQANADASPISTDSSAPQADVGENTIDTDELASQAGAVSAEDQQAQLEQIAFIGDVFAPFFLQDPLTGCAGASFAAMAALDPAAAAAEWPFVDAQAAEGPLALMAQGAADTAENLAHEYRRLFVGPAHKAAPPWGSVYTDRECVMFGESTLELRRWMREHGLVAPEGTRTPEDHIGLLLGLMAQLAQTAPAELDGFMAQHLLTWSHHFLALMAQEAQHPFYQGLAQLTDASLEGIRASRGIQVTYPRFYR